MAGAPKLARIAPWAAGIALLGAGIITALRLPNALRADPVCEDLAACQAACDDGHAWGCFALAKHYADGEGIAKNPGKALALWTRACDDGDGDACSRMSWIHRLGMYRQPKDAEKSKQYEGRMFQAYRRACDEGLASSCFALGRSHEDGKGTGADPAKAAAAFERVRVYWDARCQQNVGKACGSLGLMHQSGILVPVNPALGLDYREKACELGVAIDCSLGGHQAQEAKALERASRLFNRGCELDDASACEAAARLTEDPQDKLALYQRRAGIYGALCEKDYVAACWRAANIYSDQASFLPKDEEKARAYTEREVALRQTGCEQGVASDCARLAAAFAMGKLVSRDIERSREFLARACELGDRGSCAERREPLSDVVDVSLGYHSCVVKSDGSVWCWGQNREGQLGDGTKEDRDRPVAAQGIPPAVAVDLYGGTSCVRTVDQQAWCWGSGFTGVTRVDGERAALEVAAGFDLVCTLHEGGDVGCSGYDAQTLELGASAVRVGGLQRCAIVKGKLMCWGSVMQEFVAKPKAVLERSDVVDASVSSEGFCALFEDGAATCRAQPLLSEPMRELELSGVRLISGDADAGCAMKGDELWCWYLREGELKKPFLVKKMAGVRKLLVRSYEGCALTADKQLFCWYVFSPEPELVTFLSSSSAP